MKAVMAALKPLALVLLGALLSATTIVFGGAPLLALRRSYGRSLYWILSATVFVVSLNSDQLLLWLPFISLVFLVGVFSELEAGHVALVPAGIISVAMSVGVAIFGFFISARVHGVSALGTVQEQAQLFVGYLQKLNPEIKLDVSALTAQVPSVVVMAALMSLWIGLLLERRFRDAFRTRPIKLDIVFKNFLQFSLPDFFIWAAIVSLLGAFVETGHPVVQVVSMNAMNILIVLFFFQGVAVLASFFQAFRVGTIWQGLIYIVLVGQLFILLSVIGFMDYWLEFRRRMSSNRPAQTTGEV